MLLVADIGNSEIDFGVLAGRSVGFHFAKCTNIAETPDEIGLFVLQMLKQHHIPISSIKGTAICSVVPEVTGIIERMLKMHFPGSPFVVTAGVRSPVKISVDHPQELGPDRLANAAGAFRRGKGAVIVVDLGTATTLTVVSRAGELVGGAILPGLKTMIGSLISKTARLPQIPFEWPARFIGRNTQDAMRSGVINGFRGGVKCLLDGITTELGEPRPTVVATGGLAPFLAKECPWLDAVDSSLTLAGIGILQRLNEK